MVAMGNPVGPCASNERNHIAGHALHSTAALAGSLHAFNSFSLAGPSWKFIKPDWNAIIFCISHLSFFHFLLLRFLLQKCFRYCHCECKWWIILSMERVRARLMNLWNTISVKCRSHFCHSLHAYCQDDEGYICHRWLLRALLQCVL